MRLLIVEDEKTLNKLISKRFENQNYEVVSCLDGEEAINALMTQTFDGVVMDIMMPKKSGLEVLEEMQLMGISVPVLLLTAKDSIEDRVIGLDLGAHDYLVKPFNFDELFARVRAMLRTQSKKVNTSVMQIADLILDKTKHIVTRDGKVIDLTAKEFDMLEYLMKYEGEVLSRERIEREVWKTDYSSGTNAIDVYIRYLRKKIDDDFEVKLIHTIRGVGYTLKVD